MTRGDDLDELISRAQSGDLPTFEALLADHLPLVRRFARAFAGSESDADDLAQDALIKVYKNIRLFRYQSAFTSWVYAVVRNAFLDHARGRRGRDRAREEPLQPEHTRDLAGGETPDEALEGARDRDRLWAALREVPVEFRTALVLFDIEGRTYDEVAAAEGVPIGTVKSRLSRGRAHLKRLLQEAAEQPGTETGVPPSHPSRSRS